jgi:UDP-N-acetylglucosamine diphosphorylase/glucosamine-1-phosphate N-acetyltransferase
MPARPVKKVAWLRNCLPPKGFVMRVCPFEDRLVGDLEPLTLTRPAFNLLCGQTTLAAKQYRAFAAGSRGAVVRPELAELVAEQSEPGTAVNDLAWLRDGPVALVNARWLPPAGAPVEASGPCVGLVEDEVAYVVVDGAGQAGADPEAVERQLPHWRVTLPARPAGGRLVRHLWELVDLNGEQIALDGQGSPPQAAPPFGVVVVGPGERLVLDPTARLDPLVVADTTWGPVVIDREAVVTAFTRLEGPCYVGPRSQVFGAKIRAGTSLGPDCRVGGEIEASILLGYSNKYHEGFLGHAYVGEWVNLGAGTHNSDLRNDYGEVRVMVAGRLVRTGRTKVGCFLGDHTKAGLGTLLNTGTSAGVFCNLLPAGGLLPRHLPSFTAVRDGVATENADLTRLLQTAAEVMRRRGRRLSESQERLYRGLFARTVGARRPSRPLAA